MDLESPTGISAGDVVVTGNRLDAQRMVIARGIALLVLSNGATATPEILALAEEHGCAVISSPLDTYVSAADDHPRRAVPGPDGERPADRRA